MQPPAMPPDEAERLAELHALQVLDTPPEQRFDRLTRLAARAVGVPIALVSLVDADRQWFKSRQGLEATETPRDVSFCGHAILGEAPFMVPDAHLDPRFADNPLVTGAPNVRAYCGIPLRGREGRMVGALCAIDTAPRAFGGDDLAVLRDLAEQVEAELATEAVTAALARLADRKAAAKRERDLFAAVLGTVASLVVMVDQEGRITLCNEACEATTGYAAAEVLGRPYWEVLLTAAAAAGAPERFAQALAGTAPVAVERPCRTKDGGERLIAWTQTGLRCPDGVIRHVVSTGLDVTAQRAAEAEIVAQNAALQAQAEELQAQTDELAAQTDALQAGEARFRALAEAAFEGICVSSRGRILHANSALAQMLGHPRAQDLVGLGVADLIAPESLDRVRAMIAAREERRYEAVAQRADGSRVDVEIVGRTVEQAGRAIRMTAMRDITERKRLDRMKQSFVAVVSHDLRTPLASLGMSLDLLAEDVLPALEEGDLREDAAASLDVARRSVDRLVRLTDDLLDDERLRTGEVAIRHEPVDARALLAEAAAGLRAQAVRAGVALEVLPGAPTVWGDRDKLMQVLTNLVGNAVKFSPGGGTVRLAAVAEGGTVELRVADEGRGVPAEKREAIFERFVQVEEADAAEKGGAGLGLAICKAIADRHGGRIWVESEAGRGSTFRVALPVPAGAGGRGEMAEPREV